MVSVGQSQMTISKKLIDSEEQIHLELVDEAKALKEEFEDLLKLDRLRAMRRPPAALSVKVRSSQFGPSLVWVKYTKRKVLLKSGGERRFTEEIRGRVNFKYPPRTFRHFEPDLQTHLIELEVRASLLRKRTVFWRDAIAQAKLLVEGHSQ